MPAGDRAEVALPRDPGTPAGAAAPPPGARPRGTGSPTLEAVAARAGVGRGTVSRVVNGSPQVSEAARAAVTRAIAELGYVPNHAARSLVTRRSDSVALVVSESGPRVFAEPFFGGVIRGVSEELARTDLQLLLILAKTEADRDRLYRFLSGRHVDGVLLASLHGGDPLPRRVAELGLPAVQVGAPADGVVLHPYVDADNRGGARAAIDHLLARGRRRIATIAGPHDMDVGGRRLDGYLDALRAAGLRTDPALVAEGDFSEDGGEQAMRRLLVSAPDLDAVFAASDLMASGALTVLTDAGRSVPGDVALVGFDDSTVAKHTRPRLTSVRQPAEAMGATTARVLTALLAGERGIEPVVVSTHLVVRDSS